MLGGWRRGLFERTGQQAGHRQDASLAGRRAGLLADQVAHLLAHRVAQLTPEGRIGLGQGLSQVAQIMGLTKLRATVGENRGYSRHQARLLGAEHGQNRPLQVRQWFQESFERGLILLRQPATA